MILILTHDAYEQGTDPVVDWLLHTGVPFIRLSVGDLIRSQARWRIDVDKEDIYIDGVGLKDRIQVVWYRRFLGESLQLNVDQIPHGQQLKAELSTEVAQLFRYVCFLLRDKVWLPAPESFQINKLEALNQARDCGLSVPAARVINNREDLTTFYRTYPAGLITKLISDSRRPYVQGKDTYVAVTQLIDDAVLDDTPAFFFPTLFQERILAAYEIRLFYLDGVCYPTAVWSSKPQHVDRKLNGATHNHYLPYCLPADQEEKIRQLMKRLKLKTGAIDIIRDQSGNYVFIEVNPVGQYLAESQHCNYALEREIATWLHNQFVS